ncbi:MAG: tetratricopeptide repeat protein [Alphaproteobacteria bacterium]|nr:tetratricopeptide repeat protein [Alphaproteobacteria bacterium]
MSRNPAILFLKTCGVITALVAFTLVAPQTAVGAPGGGSSGGGSMPSTSGRGGDPARAYQEGVAAMEARDYRTAVAKFRTVVGAAPNDPSVNYAYALALIGNGEPRDAIRPLQRSLRSDAAPPDARKQLGLIHLQLGDRAKATEQLAAAAASLAACDAACGDVRRAQFQAAHDALKAALDAPVAPAAPTTGWLIPGPLEGREAYAAAVGLVNQERFAEALAALDVAQAAIGPHPDILNYRGFASRKLGRFDAAMGFYVEALALDPDHRGANEYLGELYLQVGRIDDARRQLAKLDTLCPYGCAEREELDRWITVAAR